MTERSLVDSFRVTHPTDPGFTWFSAQRTRDSPPPKRRLDLMLTKGAAWDALASVNCVIETLSDHRPLVAAFELANQLQRGPGTFRLNTELLNQQGILDWTTAHWRDWQQTKGDFETEEQWLQMGFRVTTRALDVFSRIQARGRRQQEQKCREMIAEAEAELEMQPLAELYWQHRRDRWLQKLEDMQVEQHVIWAQRAQEKGLITADRMSKETFQRIWPPRQNALIRELHHPFYAEAPPAKDSDSIGEYALCYFQDILTSIREPDLSPQQLKEERDLWQHTAVRLPPEGCLKLEEPFTLDELWSAVKSMAHGKSPRSDGLPVEFYEATWEFLGPELLSLFNRILAGGSLTHDMKKGITTLIYKKGDKCNIRNWRPISRLNVSYKILAKLLARRLSPYLPLLVHTDAENIMMAVGALEVIQSENRQVLIAMLDLKKAYDRVNWSFVLATLEHMGFGPRFQQIVRELYIDATATVNVNGFQSASFTLSRSLRQGCPLASLLFTLQMEVLLNSLRASPRIQGLDLGNGEQMKTGAIADDLLLVVEAVPESTQEVKTLLDSYATLSEAQVNWEKSVYFLPADYELSGQDWDTMDQDAEGGEQDQASSIDGAEEQRIQTLLQQCFIQGNIPDLDQYLEVDTEEDSINGVVHEDFNKIQIQWLKDHTVVFIFGGKAKNLGNKEKLQFVRNLEDGRLRPEFKALGRGSTHVEGRSMITYIARSIEAKESMMGRKPEINFTLDRQKYKVIIRLWLPKNEWETERERERVKNYWVMAVRFPLYSLSFIRTMVKKAIGPIVKEFEPVEDESMPHLVNAKFGIDRSHESRFKPVLTLRVGLDTLSADLVANITPWCRTCRWYGHYTTECPDKEEESKDHAPRRSDRSTRFRQEEGSSWRPSGPVSEVSGGDLRAGVNPIPQPGQATRGENGNRPSAPGETRTSPPVAQGHPTTTANHATQGQFPVPLLRLTPSDPNPLGEARGRVSYGDREGQQVPPTSNPVMCGRRNPHSATVNQH
ncbi:hypothetical protein CBR_g36352 [Chara braunii]|uniref:Reverse transcriptase domain-containing protein n=1 Tax=Chara braunii TaxID=69332 RepID=A0A388LKN9_CHABU|nr:hypothetical protein CBR_g36352 [Chara braunii]|eukprot:GBG82821.1 hypothetical protein CBR_g36352 [Chara braunii]